MAGFSDKFEKLLGQARPITWQALGDNFAEKSFAVMFLLLLTTAALPLPTGGVTHVFEIIAMLLALELIAGRKTVWLPKSWRHKAVPTSLRHKALPKLVRFIRWLEKFSRPRLRKLHNHTLYVRLVGVLVFIFTFFAFIAPPFTELDTLPALGVVLLSLGIIFEDALVSFIGAVAGSIGVVLVLLLGKAVFQLF